MKKLTIKDFTPCIPLNQIEHFEKYAKPSKAMLKKLHQYTTPLIMWTEIELKLGKREFKKFMHWMRGQTSMEGGVYSCDLEQYLRAFKRPIFID